METGRRTRKPIKKTDERRKKFIRKDWSSLPCAKYNIGVSVVLSGREGKKKYAASRGCAKRMHVVGRREVGLGLGSLLLQAVVNYAVLYEV